MNTIQEAIIIPTVNSILELVHMTWLNKGQIFKSISIGLLIFASVSSIGYYQLALWCIWWVFLGILSSVGLGFGMHTFVLFLGPHIAAVTMAAHDCNSLEFPQPPYPNKIICPSVTRNIDISFVNILQKVALESFMWGLGTAIGELPPYLAARLRAKSLRHGGDNLHDDMQGWELWMMKFINKVGFFGILLAAAIPNPLFDVAGIASGIAEVPFMTFFGATMIGKAIIKVSLQSCFVIAIFHSNNLELMLLRAQNILSNYFSSLRDFDLHEIIKQQRSALLRKQITETQESSLISLIFKCITTIIMVGFVISLIRALDQRRRERLHQNGKKKD